MSTKFYPSAFIGTLRTGLLALAAGLLLAPAATAQIDIPAGNPNTASGRRPLGTWYGYERSALIYTSSEINATAAGNITSVGFYLNAASTPGDAPTKIYMKTVTNTDFAAATTVATEEAGATLVYDATIPAASFTPNTWITVPLTTPFAYPAGANLEVIVETNSLTTGNETNTGKVFRYASTGTANRAQFWATDNTAPTTTGTLSTTRPNIRLVGLTVAPITDAAVQVLYASGKAPVNSSQTVQVRVLNNGNQPINNLPVALAVSGANTFTNVQTVSTLAVGASTLITFPSYTPAAVGNNTVTVTVQDAITSNNTATYAQAVTANDLSYIDASQPLNAAGIGVSSTTPNGILASRFTINTAATIGEIRFSLAAATGSTSTFQGVILDATGPGGAPGAVLFTSPTQTRTAAAATVTIPVTGNILVNGPFYVGVKEISGNVQIAYQLEAPLRAATYYFQGGGTTTWTDVSTTTFTTRLAMEVNFSARALSTNSPALSQAISMYPNPSTGLVSLDIRNAKATGDLQVQVTNLLGQVVHTATVRDNALNKLDLSNLAAGMYSVRVQSGNAYTVRQLQVSK